MEHRTGSADAAGAEVTPREHTPARLDALLDIPAIQALMDDFHELTGLPIGLLDLDSNVLVGTGWKDACTRFHRACPESFAACLESDRAQSDSVRAGEYRGYRCGNGMWDVVTPLFVGGEHVGNVFVGQFFYDDEEIDLDFFRAQAERYGYEVDAYLTAIASVPRFSHQTIDRLMRFYAKLTGQLAALGDANRRLRDAASALANATAGDESFRMLIERAPLGVAISRDATLVYANHQYAAMLGFDDPGDLIGTNIFTLVAARDLPGFMARARAREQGLPVDQTYEVRGLRRDGEEIPVMVSALRVELPDGPAVLGMFQDLSAQRRTEEALRQSEARFSTAFHTSPDAVTINRMSDGLYVAINEGFSRLLGYSVDEVMGKTSVDLGIWSIPEDRDRLVAGLLETGHFDNLESPFRGKSGTLTTGLMSARVMDFDGERCILAVTRDITERKAAEDQIIALNQRLEDRVRERTSELASVNEELTALNEQMVAANEDLAHANHELDKATRAKNEFLASMSHELRTPLNSILGFSGILLGDLAGPLGDEQRRQLTMINNSGRHLLELINGVLDLAKVEAGQADPVIEQVDPSATASEALESVRPLAEEKGLVVSIDCPSNVPDVRTDRTRLLQILLNLLGNAVKFTPTGHITLRVSRIGDDLRFEVGDTGHGIALEDQARVFDQFYQGRPRDQAKTAGTGLGLSVSLSLARTLGGDIEMHSEPGVGSTFTLVLPVRAETPGRRAAAL